LNGALEAGGQDIFIMTPVQQSFECRDVPNGTIYPLYGLGSFIFYSGGTVGSPINYKFVLVQAGTVATDDLSSAPVILSGVYDGTQTIEYVDSDIGLTDWDGVFLVLSSSSNNDVDYQIPILAIGYHSDEVCVNLPVELTSFEAKAMETETALHWATATEDNNDFFEVQRSNNGTTWQTLGEVKGAGTTIIAQQYAFRDYHPNIGTNYYRLKQVDFNGDFEFSNIEVIQFSRTNTPIVYIAKESKLYVNNASKCDVSIYNIQGQRVLYKPAFTDTHLSIDNQLSKGVYVVQVVMPNGKVRSTKFIK